ncbi:RNA polymerase sigma factor [Thalassoroseus pseudoceratinae]|uniref:RNA polymerase sigma factor n=1 Tax=Thalassoroseus pseudoceratinae TaxID=2713176 RepID=UPI001423770C|nr:sigma-70 family RNA polymerase sigma factor [Thalassoroseus pseudoceratinae]
MNHPPESEGLDAAAIESLYSEHAHDLRAFLIGVLKDGDLAVEALQNTFSKAVERGDTVRQETVKGWLYRVALNEALELRRRNKTHTRTLLKLQDWQNHRGAESPHDQASREETSLAVREAIKSLSPEQRSVVQLRIYEDKTFAAIAEELDLPLGTVLTRMRTALKRLAVRISPEHRP